MRPTHPAPSSSSARSTGDGVDLIGDIRRETTSLLDDTLGSELRRELRTRGEGMDADQSVTYALEHMNKRLRSAI